MEHVSCFTDALIARYHLLDQTRASVLKVFCTFNVCTYRHPLGGGLSELLYGMFGNCCRFAISGLEQWSHNGMFLVSYSPFTLVFGIESVQS